MQLHLDLIAGKGTIVASRETLRRDLADAVAAATEREYEEQDWLRNTEDFREGVDDCRIS
jgi:hypothetical protein